MGQALYRKYRSKKLSEIVGQDHITATLHNALKKGAISHAYLLTGPRGVGKTSIARILAHEVNQLPYQDETTHLDIIEIDAASNRRIDEIRELRERVHTAPTSATYKVYIIDEVHMLTKEAFNALLKTLEEPPAHVIFILATTEPHKLPDTIISRTQRFNFRPIEKEVVIQHLASLAKEESISVEPAALSLMAEHGGGSFRDSISLLDQARGVGKTITQADIEVMLGLPSKQAIEEIIEAMRHAHRKQLIDLLTRLRDQGFLPVQIAKQLSQDLRQLLIDDNVPETIADVHTLLRELIEIPASHDPEGLLEIILLAHLTSRSTAQKSEVIPSVDKVKRSEKQATPAAASKTSQSSVSKKGPLGMESWQKALDALRQRHNTLYSIARMAQPHFEGKTLMLEFSFAFHQQRLDEDKNKQIIKEVLSKIVGHDVEVICKLNRNQKASFRKPEIDKKPDPSLDAISNIFGSAEMLES